MFKIYIKRTRKIVSRETSYVKVVEWLQANAEKENGMWFYNNQKIDFEWYD